MRRARVGVGFGFAGGSPPPVTVTFNPADKSTSFDLSGSDLIATKNAGGWGGALGTQAQSTGKRYFEITLNVTDTAEQFGVLSETHAAGDAAFNGGASDGNNDFGVGLDSRNSEGLEEFNFTIAGLNAYACPAGTVVGVAVDFVNSRIWWSLDGDYGAVRTGSNPATNTLQHASWADGTRSMFPGFWGFGATSQGTLAASGTFVHGPPSGFVAWNA